MPLIRFLTLFCKYPIMISCECGGTAYTADLKSAGESLRVQIPPTAPCRRGLHSVRGDFFQIPPYTPSRLLSAKSHARVCSLVNALAATRCRYRLAVATNFLRLRAAARNTYFVSGIHTGVHWDARVSLLSYMHTFFCQVKKPFLDGRYTAIPCPNEHRMAETACNVLYYCREINICGGLCCSTP